MSCGCIDWPCCGHTDEVLTADNECPACGRRIGDCGGCFADAPEPDDDRDDDDDSSEPSERFVDGHEPEDDALDRQYEERFEIPDDPGE